MIEMDYGQIKAYTLAIIKRRYGQSPQPEADEIINEAYIRMYDSGEGYSLKQFFGWVKYELFAYRKRIVHLDIEQTYGKLTFDNDEKRCIKCTQWLPVQCFPIKRKDHTGVHYKSCCKECQNKIDIARIHTRKIYNPRAHQVHTERQKNRKAKGINELAPWYIRAALRYKYSREYIEANPHLVKEAAIRILLKRSKKVQKIAAA